jgi:hypothetical protein
VVFRINQLRSVGLSQPVEAHVRYTRHVWVCYARAAL